uniref:NADH dehydrogenase subunit 6 n=1 Tax=Hydropsyche simulata TaxID=761879 RepID=UPI0022387C6D|nr:NADH dehydrogenase subunit 6 [Hydropsyche simulata]UYO79328.1 NADH dehydrogenase subunit 6 [Hydropsyche simulata]
MMKMSLLTLFLTLTMLMYFIKNPLNMGLLILSQTLIICFLMNFYLNYYWLSYILYLIMLGGILILFMYMCSIASNKIIQFNTNLFLYMILIFFITFMFIYKFKWINLNLLMINNHNFFFSNEMFSMSKIYNNYTYKITIMLIIYLFILLLMVTMFTNSNKGPLRIMNV